MKLGTTGRSVRNDALVERSVRRSRVAGRRVHTGLAEIGTTNEEEREAKSGKRTFELSIFNATKSTVDLMLPVGGFTQDCLLSSVVPPQSLAPQCTLVVMVNLLHCILNLCPKILFVYYNGIFSISFKSNVVLNTKRLAGYPTLSSQGLGFVADMQFGRVQSQINFSQKLSFCPFFFYKLIDNLLFICLYCI